jgi:hypothetical protein
MKKNPSQGFFIELLELSDPPVETVYLIKNPKSSNDSSPKIIAVAVNIIDKAQPHADIELLIVDVLIVI